MTSKDDEKKPGKKATEKKVDDTQQNPSAGGDENREDTQEPKDGCSQEGKMDSDKEKSPASEAPEEKPAAEEEALQIKYTRLMADFQNFKRRTEKEKSDIYAFANEKIVSELLNVIDNFERALAHGSEGDSFAEGMNMIFKQLTGVLEKAGVVEIEALGMDFDPNFHNAVMTEDSTEYESGKVTEVLQKGYLLNSKVIRPSMVKVAN